MNDRKYSYSIYSSVTIVKKANGIIEQSESTYCSNEDEEDNCIALEIELGKRLGKKEFLKLKKSLSESDKRFNMVKEYHINGSSGDLDDFGKSELTSIFDSIIEVAYSRCISAEDCNDDLQEVIEYVL